MARTSLSNCVCAARADQSRVSEVISTVLKLNLYPSTAKCLVPLAFFLLPCRLWTAGGTGNVAGCVRVRRRVHMGWEQDEYNRGQADGAKAGIYEEFVTKNNLLLSEYYQMGSRTACATNPSPGRGRKRQRHNDADFPAVHRLTRASRPPAPCPGTKWGSSGSW
jgi:hypothetical protein